MLRNYFLTATRHLLRGGVHSLISIFGLAIGMAACILAGLYIHDESRVDAWHTKGNRIYRMIRQTNSDGRSEFSNRTAGGLGVVGGSREGARTSSPGREA